MAQLRSYVAELEALLTRVVLISFGSTLGAKTWLEETKAPFLILLDPQRIAYRAYGLERSLLRSWEPKVWWHYARLILAGQRWRGIQGDSSQLGGDFIVDQNGIIRLAYSSHDPTDRPTISQLMAVLELSARTNQLD